MLEFTLSAEEGAFISSNAPHPWDGVNINDHEAVRSFERLKQNVLSWRRRLSLQPSAPLMLQELRLPHQGLGDRAVRGMVEAFVKGTVQISVVELYKNRVGDAGAQALSVLLECCPAPGLKRLHMSHNYFSQVGVGLLLTSAARSGRYPRQEAEASVPLWLRVENQMCPWPVLSGAHPNVQLEKSELLLGHLGKKIVKGLQESGHLGRDYEPGSFKIFCIPRPPPGHRQDGEEDGLPDFSGREAPDRFQSMPCNSDRCCHGWKHGPMVHLPYFWSQNGHTQKMPEAASLHQNDKTWKTWLPPIPIGSRKRAAPNSFPSASKDGPAPEAKEEATADAASVGPVLPLDARLATSEARPAAAATSTAAPAGVDSASASSAKVAAKEAKIARREKPAGGGASSAAAPEEAEAAAVKRTRLHEPEVAAQAVQQTGPRPRGRPRKQAASPAAASAGSEIPETLLYPEEPARLPFSARTLLGSRGNAPPAEASVDAIVETLHYRPPDLPSFSKPLRLAAATTALDLD